MRRWIPCLVLLLACDDADYAPRLDLDGPQGVAIAPGPWRLQIFAEGTPAAFARVDDGAFAPVVLAPVGDGWAGLLPAAPVGARVSYFARDGAALEPPEGERQPRSFTVAATAPGPVAPPAPCRLAFRWPIDGLEVTALADGAPQAGIQLVVVVDSNLADGQAARLGVVVDGDEVESYSGAAGAGVVAFDAVTIPEGEIALIAEATVAGGDACAARVTVSR